MFLRIVSLAVALGESGFPLYISFRALLCLNVSTVSFTGSGTGREWLPQRAALCLNVSTVSLTGYDTGREWLPAVSHSGRRCV